MKVVFKRCYDISKVILMTTSELQESQNKQNTKYWSELQRQQCDTEYED